MDNKEAVDKFINNYREIIRKEIKRLQHLNNKKYEVEGSFSPVTTGRISGLHLALSHLDEGRDVSL